MTLMDCCPGSELDTAMSARVQSSDAELPAILEKSSEEELQVSSAFALP